MRLAEEPPVVGFACFFVERLRTEICMEGTAYEHMRRILIPKPTLT
jgi:hypothetical protein